MAINAELVCDTTTPFLFLHQSHGGGRGFLMLPGLQIDPLHILTFAKRL